MRIPFVYLFSLLIFVMVSTYPSLSANNGNSVFYHKQGSISFSDYESCGILNWTSVNFSAEVIPNVYLHLFDARCNSSRVDLLCVRELNSRLGLRYIPDDEDALYLPSSFLARGGGDCEDWSVFIGTLLQDKEVIAWKHGLGMYYFDYGTQRFAANDTLSVYVGKVNGILCIKENLSEGHCLLKTDLGYLVEAQTGELSDLSVWDLKKCGSPEDRGCVYWEKSLS